MVVLTLPLQIPVSIGSLFELIFATGEEKKALSEQWIIIFPIIDFPMGLIGLLAVFFNYTEMLS